MASSSASCRSSIRPASSCSWATQPQLEKEVADLRAKLDAHAARRRATSSSRRSAQRSRPRSARCSIRPPNKLTPEQAEQALRSSSRRSTSPIAKWPSESPSDQPAKANRPCSWPARSSATDQQLQLHDQLQARRQLRLLANACRLRANARRARRPRS